MHNTLYNYFHLLCCRTYFLTANYCFFKKYSYICCMNNNSKQNIETSKRNYQGRASDLLLFTKDIASFEKSGPAFVFISMFVRSK